MSASPPPPVPPAVRRAIQTSSDSIRTLAARHGINPKTVAKWRGRSDTADRKRGPAQGKSRTLSATDEAFILAVRRYLPLSLDDSMATLGARLPALGRSALHRLLKRHNLSRPPARDIFALPEAASRPGCFHIDIVPIVTGGREHYLFFAVEQSSALIFGLMRPDATQATARDFLEALADGAPAPVRIVLTSDRFQFTAPGNSASGVADVRDALEKGTLARVHPFEYACALRGIEHHLVPDHFPWDAARADEIARAAAGIARMAAPDAALARRGLHAELGRHNHCPLPSLGGLSPGDWLAATDDSRTIIHRDRPDRDSSPTSPRSDRRDSTREAILEAAHNRLARDGPEGLSLSEVARLAGVNRGTAYQHFRTRDGLIAATGEWMADRLHRAVFAGRAPSAAALGEKGMASIAGRLARLAMDHPVLCRAWLLQLMSAPDPMQDRFWRDYRTAMAALAPAGDRQDEAMDSEVASVAMLAGAFLWPTWASEANGAGEANGAAGTNVSGAPDPLAMATRFALEWLRIARPGRR